MKTPPQKWLALALCVLTATAALAAEVTVQAGETLPRIAQRTLGDPGAASELKALNQLASDQVPAGTVLQLPGSERSLAVSAISAARNAVTQAGTDSPRREEASRQLADAEALLKQARYHQAADAADSAWKLVSEGAGEKTRFTVEVDKQGKTEVRTSAGQPVRVEAQGKVQPVSVGEVVAVAKGEAPRKLAERPLEKTPDTLANAIRLEAPLPLSPPEKHQLKLQPRKNGTLGPVNLSWRAVPGATAYEVEVTPQGGKPLQLKVEKPTARITTLSPGTYGWTVRALGEGIRSERSGPRSFQLASDGLKLEVKGTQWK
ncbi:MAG: LysM peptidoglycan-binding domain-containing protein [Myxococcota bacterium]|nr:LysM peptidoglycan-binding domain-containing protein [Myxococcota bacterium]